MKAVFFFFFFFLGGGGGVGFFTEKQYKLFTLGTVSCFSEQDIHCFYVKNLPKRITSWDCASSKWRVFLLVERVGLYRSNSVEKRPKRSPTIHF